MDYGRWFWERIVGVQVDGAMHALVAYLIPLFNGEKNAVAVACPRSKMEEIGGFFRERVG